MPARRHKMVDYLPYMHTYKWVLQSRRPKPVASYVTIVKTYDNYTWGFNILSLVVKFFLLLLVQNMWSKVSGGANPQDYIYEGQQATG